MSLSGSHIDILTHYFYPENAAVAQYMTELAVELRRQGLEIRVLTSRSSYHRRTNLSSFEVHQDIQINRFGADSFDNSRLWGRLINISSFILGALCELLTCRRSDLLVVANAPILGVLGWLAKILRKQKYLCIIEDVFPDLATKLNVFSEKSLFCKVWDSLNYRVYTNAESLIVLGKKMEAIVRKKLPPETSIFVIHHWADGEAIHPIQKEDNWFAKEHKLEGKFVILYSGNHGRAHDLETIIEAAERLKDDPQFLFLFIGDGNKKKQLIDMAARKNLPNIRFLPYQPLENLPYSMTCGDIAVVAMEPGIDGLLIPSKIYGALAAGQAILGLVGHGTEIADIISEYSCGYRIAPKDVEAAVRVLILLAENSKELERMKKNARYCFEKNFDKKRALTKYLEVFERTIER